MSHEGNHDRARTAIRIRPLNEDELVHSAQVTVHEATVEVGPSVTVQHPSGNKTFAADVVFPRDASQEEVYSTVCRPLISGIRQGRSGTVLACGNVGSGKRYTLFGAHGQPGLVLRAARDLLADANLACLSLQCLAIRDERAFDLLTDPDAALPVRRDGLRLSAPDESWKRMRSADEVRTALQTIRRNPRASYAPEEFVISLRLPAGDGLEEESPRLMFATRNTGRMKRTGPHCGGSLADAVRIGLGVGAFSDVVCAVAKGDRHVPFRNSLLTRLLVDSFEDPARMVAIATVSPCPEDVADAVSALRLLKRIADISPAQAR